MQQEVNGSRRALALAANPGRFLSTVQIGITLIGIIAGAFSGATLAGRLVDWLLTQGLTERVAEPLAYGSVVTLITYLSLIIGELVPKQIALRNPGEDCLPGRAGDDGFLRASARRSFRSWIFPASWY